MTDIISPLLVSELSGCGSSVVPIIIPYHRAVGVFCICCYGEYLSIRRGHILFKANKNIFLCLNSVICAFKLIFDLYE